MPETSTLLHALPDGYNFAHAKGSVAVHIMHRSPDNRGRKDSACKQLRGYGAQGLRPQDGPAPPGLVACTHCHAAMHDAAKRGEPLVTHIETEQHAEDQGLGICNKQGVLIAECDPDAHRAWHATQQGTPPPQRTLTVDPEPAGKPKRRPRKDKGIPRGPKDHARPPLLTQREVDAHAKRVLKAADPARRRPVVSVVEAVPDELPADDRAWLDRTTRHLFEGKPLVPSIEDRLSAGRVALHLARSTL